MLGELLKFEKGKVQPGSETKSNPAEFSKLILKSIDQIFKDAAERKASLGWMRLPEDQSAMKEIKGWLKKLKNSQKTLCVFGIGGSFLGAKAVYDFLNLKKKILFFDNIDGFAFEKRMAELDLKKCHFLVISKSGETSETLFQLARLLELLDKRRLKFANHVTVITESKDSTLTRIANSLNFSKISVPLDVGGRFSVFSAVGLAPLMWAEAPVTKLLQGALWAKNQKALTAEIASFYLHTFQRSESISVFWCYVDGLRTFGLWVEQLWAESLGKARDRKGGVAKPASTPIACIGATDQHSLLQQFTEGPRDKSFLFLRSKRSELSPKIKKIFSKDMEIAKNRSIGELLGIEASASQRIVEQIGISTSRLTLKDQNAETFGALLFIFELLVATLGECLDLNAFDQPGVEGVKKVTLGTLGDPRFKDHALV